MAIAIAYRVALAALQAAALLNASIRISWDATIPLGMGRFGDRGGRLARPSSSDQHQAVIETDYTLALLIGQR